MEGRGSSVVGFVTRRRQWYTRVAKQESPRHSFDLAKARRWCLLPQPWEPLVVLERIELCVARVGDEEALMTEESGDQYRAYMRRTGRFLPPMRLKRT